MRDTLLQDFSLLLEAENTAIMRGEYHVLDDTAARKLSIFQQLQKVEIRQDDLQQLARNIQKNQALLGAAIKGVGAARERILALRDVRRGLQVYDQSGQFADLPVARPDLLKKA